MFHFFLLVLETGICLTNWFFKLAFPLLTAVVPGYTFAMLEFRVVESPSANLFEAVGSQQLPTRSANTVFVNEIALALLAASILNQGASAKPLFEVKNVQLEKDVPGANSVFRRTSYRRCPPHQLEPDSFVTCHGP